MHILVLNFLLCLLYALIIWVFPVDNKVKGKIFFVVTFIQLVVVHTFIGPTVPADIPAYESFFYNIKTNGISEVPFQEGLFYLLMFICSKISSSFVFFLLVFSVVFMILYYKTIKKYSPYVVISVLLFLLLVFNQSIYVLRQCMAMAIMLMSYDKIINRELYKFLIIVVIAFFFHQTAIVFLPVYFLYGIKNNKTLIWSLAGSAVLLFLRFELFYSYVGTNWLSKYSMYVDADETINATRFLMSLVIFGAFILVLKKDVYEKGINRLLFIMLAISVMASFLGTGFAQSDRLFEYYTACSFLSIPITQKYFKTKWLGYLFSIISVILYFYLSFHNFETNVLFNAKLVFSF